jgi:transposase InsO family protein
MLIVPPPRQQTDRSATDSSNSRELKSDEQLQHGSTHDPRPSCAGTAQVQTLAGRAGDMDGLSGNVPLHCTSQVQLTAHANAFMESFYKTLKYEEVNLCDYETYDDVIERLPFFLEEVYNRKRLHSSIGYVPPTEFEAAVSNMKPADRPVLNL